MFAQKVKGLLGEKANLNTGGSDWREIRINGWLADCFFFLFFFIAKTRWYGRVIVLFIGSSACLNTLHNSKQYIE